MIVTVHFKMLPAKETGGEMGNRSGNNIIKLMVVKSGWWYIEVHCATLFLCLFKNFYNKFFKKVFKNQKQLSVKTHALIKCMKFENMPTLQRCDFKVQQRF